MPPCISARITLPNEITITVWGLRIPRKVWAPTMVKILGKSPCFVLTITSLIGFFFKSGVFPSHWKNAKVVPIFKAGNIEIVDNYRPISVLNSFIKVIERIAFNHIYAFLINENLLHLLQSGFHLKHSTTTPLINLIDTIYNDMDESLLTGAIFLDLRKAFDTVDHTSLLAKVKRFNPDDNIYRWLNSYLSQRNQVFSVTFN